MIMQVYPDQEVPDIRLEVRLLPISSPVSLIAKRRIHACMSWIRDVHAHDRSCISSCSTSLTDQLVLFGTTTDETAVTLPSWLV